MKYAIQPDIIELTGLMLGYTQYLTAYRREKYRGEVYIIGRYPRSKYRRDISTDRLDALTLLTGNIPDHDTVSWLMQFDKPRIVYTATLEDIVPTSKLTLSPEERIVLKGNARSLYKITNLTPYTGKLIPTNLPSAGGSLLRMSSTGECFTRYLTKQQAQMLYNLCERVEYNQRAEFIGVPDRMPIEGHEGWFINGRNYRRYRLMVFSGDREGTNVQVNYLRWRENFKHYIYDGELESETLLD